MMISEQASANEERYVLAETFTPHVFSIPYIFRITGQLDVERLEQALVSTCRRHAAFRSGFRVEPTGRVSKYFVQPRDVELTRCDLPDADLDQVRAFLYPRIFVKVDFTPQSLSSFYLLRISDETHYLCLNLHHTIADGQSMRIFVRELFATYGNPGSAEDAEEAPIFSDPDWQQSRAYEDACSYWRDALQHVPEQQRVAEDVAMPARKRQGSVAITLSPSTMEKARAAAEGLGISLFTYFYAVSFIALGRLVGSSSVSIVFQSDGRRDVPHSDQIIGAMSNALVVASHIDETESFSDFTRGLKLKIKDALSHEAYPYHHVIEHTGVHPGFGMNWYPELEPIDIPDLQIEMTEMLDRQSDYDLNIRVVRRQDSASLLIFHNPAISNARCITIASHIAALAEAFAEVPHAAIESIPSAVFAPAAALPAWDMPLEQPQGERLHLAFERRAAIAPDATAIVHDQAVVTYGDLAARVAQLNAQLAAAGFGRGSRLVIIADREPTLIWTMLAAARLGAIFIALDSSYPAHRLEQLAQTVAPAAVLGNLSGPSRHVVQTLAERLGLAAHDISLDRLSGDGDTFVAQPGSPDDLAYFLFTSGSTGQPKCVACTHRPLSHFVKWQAEAFGLNADDRFTMLSGLSHDPLLRDIFTPLAIGAAILIPDSDDVIREPGRLAAWFGRHNPTIAHMTPPLVQLLTAGTQAGRAASLRHVFMGGDMLRPQIVADLEAFAPNVAVTNFYGSTETPQAASYFRWDGDSSRATVPIGRGSAGYQLGVLDPQGNLCGVGDQGEVAVRSRCLSAGYVHGQTLEVAPQDRETDAQGEPTIYRTGDRGYFHADGNVTLIGRGDDQIKIRGFRVDLSEVTAGLLALSSVRSATALAIGDDENRRIVAFVVKASGHRSPAQLLSELSEMLPPYMVPSQLEILDTLPLLSNGKIDRRQLERIAEQTMIVKPASPPRTSRESAIAAAWSPLLRRDDISRDMSFADLGGDSLSYVQAYLATEELIGRLPTGWQFMKIAELAQVEGDTKSSWGFIDTPIVIRAISIVLVVCAHFHLTRYRGGATSALFMVSGYIFAGFQLKEVFARHSGLPILRLFMKVLVPTVLFGAFLYFGKSAFGRNEPHLSTLLLYSDFVSPFEVGNDFYLWYVHCMLQILLLVAGCYYLLRRWPALAASPFHLAVTIFGIAFAAKMIVPPIAFPGYYQTPAKEMHVSNYMLTTHWATFALGSVLALARSRRERVAAMLIVLVYTVATGLFFYSVAWAFIAAAAPLLMWVPSLPIWRPLSKGVLSLSGASLFIYFTHTKYFYVYDQMNLSGWTLLKVVVALLGGVLTWYLWQFIWNRGVAKLRHEKRATVDDELAHI